MSWTKVQSATSDGAPGSSPFPCAFPSPVTAGNLLVAFFDSDSATMTASDDTGHNTWALVKAQADSGNDQKGAMWYAIAAQSEACTVQLTTAGAFRGIIIEEWAHTGGGTIAPDLSDGLASTSQFPPTQLLTPSDVDALVLVYGQSNLAGLIAADEVEPPFTFEDGCSIDSGAPSVNYMGVASYQQATPAAVDTNWNYDASGQCATIIASFLATVTVAPAGDAGPTLIRLIGNRQTW